LTRPVFWALAVLRRLRWGWWCAFAVVVEVVKVVTEAVEAAGDDVMVCDSVCGW
jgi:hypothetical protein